MEKRDGQQAFTQTLAYYERNADAFLKETAEIPFSEIQDQFLSLVPEGGRILDFGCGSGRDAKYFSQKGFLVDAADGSEKMCAYARKFTGLPVKCLLFGELDSKEEYDGIWACASILHLTKKELKEVFPRMRRALKGKGILYASFKYGKDERMRDGRYYTDFTEETFLEFLSHTGGFSVRRLWISHDARPDRNSQRWLNALLQKEGKEKERASF